MLVYTDVTVDDVFADIYSTDAEEAAAASLPEFEQSLIAAGWRQRDDGCWIPPVSQ